MPVPTYARLLLEARDLQNELIDPHRAWSRQVRALLEKLESSS
jgi:hypothetical protein